MFEAAELGQEIPKEQYKARVPTLRTELLEVQRKLTEAKFPVIIVFAGVDGAGKPSHNEWTGKFDGKDYPVTGDPSADARSLKLASPGRYALSNSKEGKTVLTGTVEFSADDKTRTLTTHTTDATGKKITSIAVYERQ
jgi:hypothetical protein